MSRELRNLEAKALIKGGSRGAGKRLAHEGGRMVGLPGGYTRGLKLQAAGRYLAKRAERPKRSPMFKPRGS